MDERSVRRRDLYPTTHNTKQQTSISPAGFEPTVSPADRPKTYALDRAATVTVKAGLTLQNLHFVHVFRSLYTGCPRRNVPDFGRLFLKLRYTDITQNTYIQS